MIAPQGHPYCTWVYVGLLPNGIRVLWCTGCGGTILKRRIRP